MDTQNRITQFFSQLKITHRVSRAVRSLITTSRDLSSHLCIISARRYHSLKKSVRYWGRHKRTFWKRQLSTTTITLVLFLLFSAIAPMLTEAATFTDLSVPNGDVSTTDWSTVGTNDGSCASGTFCNFVDEGSTVDTADYVQAPASGAGGELLTLDMENTFVGDSATQLVFYVNARAINDANGNPDLLELRLSINGADLATTSQTLTTTYTWYSVTYTGNWTQADIDSMQAKMTRQYQGGGNPSTRSDDTQIAATYVDITYEQSNTFEQSAYRWFGNQDATNPTNEWVEATSSANWSAREDHASVVFNDKIWILGGHKDGTYYNDVWSSSDGTTWTQETAAANWSARSTHTALVYNNKIWVVGGYDGTYYNDVWSSSDGVTWTQETAAANWSARRSHASVIFGNKMWVMGGYDGTYKNDIWSSSDGVTWTQETAAANWSARRDLAATVFAGKIWIFAGNDSNTASLNDVYSSADGATWALETSTPGWSQRERHVAVTYKGRMWVMGGFSVLDAGGEGNNDTWSSTDGTNWTQEVTSAGWVARQRHTGVVFDSSIYISGGHSFTNSAEHNDVWFYNSLVTLGPALAAQDTATTAPDEGTPFRLRANAHVGVAELPADSGSFKLQYAQQGSDGVCDPSFSGESYQDVLDPANLTQAGTISNPDLDGARDVDVAGDYAYVTSSTADSLSIIDISDPANPTQTGTISTTALDGAWSVHLVGYYAYVASYEADSLTVIDISTPSSPTQVGTISSTDLDTAESVHVAGDYAYVASSTADSLSVIDISDPANPTQTGTISNPDLDAASGVQVAGNYAYVASSFADSLTVIDISLPALSFYDNTNLTDGMALSSSVDDPQHNTDTNVYQSYVESNNFTNPNAIPNGSDGLWDFSLVDNSAPGDTSYCFRIVNSGGSELNTYSSIAEIETQPPVYSQEDYRWFENQDKELLFGGSGVVQSNPTTGTDAAYATAKDSEYLYTAGYYSANGNDWRVEKRKLSDGALCSAAACDTEFGSNGVLNINPSGGDDRIHSIDIDNNHIYLAGYDTAPGNIQWRIEKRNKSTGALDTNFGTNGVVAYNYGSLDDIAHSIATYGDYVYIAGYEGIASGNTQGRVEKRSKATGALCDSGANCSDGQFATNGYYRYSPTTGGDGFQGLTVDDSGVYVAGLYDDLEATVHSLDAVNGTVNSSLVFDITAGVVDQPAYNGITTDDAYVYIGGQADDATADSGWWASKHNKSTLSLCSSGTECTAGAFDGDGLLQIQPSGAGDSLTGIATDATSYYLMGTDRSQDGGMSRYLIQKRDIADGSLDTTFGTGGEVTYNPSTNHDEPRGIVINDRYAWIVGYDAAPGNYEINTQKRYLSDGSFVGDDWGQDTASASWSPREGHTSVSFNDKIWIIGGQESGGLPTNNVWNSEDGVNWQETTTTLPANSFNHTSVVFNNKMWLIGGETPTAKSASVSSSADGANWTQETSSPGWAARSDHTSVVYDGKMWVIGGEDDSNNSLNDVWSSTDGINWTQETSSPGWAARSDHTSVVYDGKMWVIGGRDASLNPFSDVWSSTDGINWTQETSSPGWAARSSHSSTVFDQKMWILGGYDGSVDTNDTWFSVDGATWQLASRGPWTNRSKTASAVNGNSLFLMGGSMNNEVWSFDRLPVDVGSIQAPTSTLYDTQSYDELVRLRSLVSITNKPAASGTFKLQYAPRFGQCDTSFTGENYVDVPGSYMTYFDNTIAEDGDSIEPSANDPSNGNTNILQSYVEANNFSLNSAVSRNENALWDFAIKETGTSGGSYCFRIVHADGSLLDNYTHIPELGVPAHTPQQLRHGRYFDTAQQARPFYW